MVPALAHRRSMRVPTIERNYFHGSKGPPIVNGIRESNGHVTDDVKLVTPIRLERNLENNWRCYLATIANF